MQRGGTEAVSLARNHAAGTDESAIAGLCAGTGHL